MGNISEFPKYEITHVSCPYNLRKMILFWPQIQPCESPGIRKSKRAIGRRPKRAHATHTMGHYQLGDGVCTIACAASPSIPSKMKGMKANGTWPLVYVERRESKIEHRILVLVFRRKKGFDAFHELAYNRKRVRNDASTTSLGEGRKEQ
jgi:hypothetical protein